ncbi:MAG: DNA adenine methylase [Alphaproteobacteria bacterium]
MKNNYIKSPLNYIGGKYKILDQIIPLFPNNINNFIDLFGGGMNVGINVHAKKIIINDHLTFLIDLYKELQKNEAKNIINYIHYRIKEYNLSKENKEGYYALRETYNDTKKPLDLLVLIAFSFNHQIRFNDNLLFNNPFGKNRSSYNFNMENNLKKFIVEIQNKNIELIKKDFTEFNYNKFNNNDFFYCDPPYLITTGVYNDGKRGFKNWTKNEEECLLKILDFLDKRKIKFALSNVLEHKDKENLILKNWIKENNYRVRDINISYKNSNYQSKNSNTQTHEVLITNYDIL